MAAATKTARQTYQDLLKESDAIEAKAKAEKRDLTEDEAARMAAIADEVAEAKATMQSEEAQAKADAKARADKAREELRAEREAAQQPLPRQVTRTNSPAQARESFLDDPKRGYRDVRAMLADVMRASVYGPSKQLMSLVPDRGYLAPAPGDREATAGSDEHSTFDMSSLGFMVPTALVPGVLTTPAPDDPFPDTMKVPLTAGPVEIVARVDKDRRTSVSGGLRVYRRAESGTVSSSRTEVEKIVLRADPVMGVSYETEELLQDAPGVALAMIEAGFRDEFAAKRVQEILTGTGAGENLGFFNVAALLIDVAKEAGQPADSIWYANLVKMLARSYGGNRWIANRTCIPQLAALNAGTNGLVWQPSAREGIPGTLLGLPITFTEYCPVVGDVGDICLVNMTQYIETIRQDVKTEESIHVRFLENTRTMRFTARRGGTPWWRTALTPKNGDSLSPFVRLAARA